ncbi:MAG: leucine-rich repeat domain-containing protein, partial [Clostridia bacterium]|nr:leucine-rich repeat domain-containing protein [Clostridia bacterium]
MLKRLLALLLMLMALLALTACGSAPATPARQNAPAAETTTAVPTATPTAVPTATPAPTSTPEPHTSGDYRYIGYIVLEDGTVEIVWYTGRDQTLVIPDTLDGKTVSRIGDQAFAFRTSLTAVTIPNSVTSIGSNPFCSCKKLTDIQVSPDHPALAVIDGVLFSKADKQLVCYPYAFTAESYVIPQGITAIGGSAFSWCTSLTSVTIPDSVTAIGDGAFESCSSLTSITIPDSVTSIGDRAFDSCSSLTSVTIPDSVTSIGN